MKHGKPARLLAFGFDALSRGNNSNGFALLRPGSFALLPAHKQLSPAVHFGGCYFMPSNLEGPAMWLSRFPARQRSTSAPDISDLPTW